MILYDLRCDKGHVFEAWFRNSASFDEQVASGEVACALCGSKMVEKAVMAPRLSRGAADGPKESEQDRRDGQAAALPENAAATDLRGKLRELRKHIESNCDYVGPDFAEEARKIHYGETEPRGIYGETSEEEAGKLHDEGVPVARIPWVRKENA